VPTPNITIKSTTKLKISDEVNQDRSTVIFSVDQPIRAWEARANGIYEGSGLLLGKSDHLFPSATTFPSSTTFPRDYTLAANTDISFDIDDEELQQDDIYRINMYACDDIDGNWNPRSLRKVRYIRDWLNGSTSNSGDHWVQVSAIDKDGTNVALNASVTASHTASNLTKVTDGTTTYSGYASVSAAEPCYVEIDMVQIYEINSLEIWHYWADGRTYHETKTEVSVDGVNWETIFNSQISGEYPETSAGNEIKL